MIGKIRKKLISLAPTPYLKAVDVVCPICDRPIPDSQKDAHHLIPKSKGGKTTEYLHRICHRQIHALFTETELADMTGMARVVDKMIQDIATRALTHCCGICGCSYVKEEGCNLMTCPKCNGMSCFICGMKLYYKGDTKYWHFTGHDKADRDARCPLWNNYAGDGKEKQGNTAFNIASIEKEFYNFISSNEGNLQVSKLIRQRIVANYENDKAFTNILKNIRRNVR